MAINWVLLSVDKVLADSQHREHLRPKYTRDQKPSIGEIRAYMANAVDDSPVQETLTLIRLMIAQGYHILLTCSNQFPFAQWFARHAPDIPLDRVAQIAWERGKTYDAQMLIQLRALRDQGDTVFMSLTASTSYMATVRYLFPKAITSVRTPDTEKAIEMREDGKAAKLDRKYPVTDKLAVRYFAPPFIPLAGPDRQFIPIGQRRYKELDQVILNNRWLSTDQPL